MTYMYILDSILKYVQGDYIKLFEERIAEVFDKTFENAKSMDEKKSLIKMFKIWDLFLQHDILDSLSKKWELPEYVRILFCLIYVRRKDY
jgi:hypothetical protein